MRLIIQHTSEPEQLYKELERQSGLSYLEEIEPDRIALAELQELISPNMKKKVN